MLTMAETITTRGTLCTERPRESGQAIILVMVCLALFVLIAAALAVDYSYLWFHRQTAQNVADAVCVAGAMDMLAVANHAPTGTGGLNPNFTSGTAFDCYTTTTAQPCWYATENSYSSTLTRAQATSTGTTAGINVYVSFPDKSACPAGAACPVPGITPSSTVSNSLMRVDVVDRVHNFFLGLLSSSNTTDVKAASLCGIVNVASAAPIGLLAPTGSSLDNNGTITIMGGAELTLAINSSSTTAVTGTGTINLVYGGPDYCGGQLLVFGGPTTSSAWGGTFCPNSTTTGCSTTNAPTSCTSPRTPKWVSPGTPASDPFSSFAAPPTTGLTTNPTVSHNVNDHGCPDPNGCDEYSAGIYTNGITVDKTIIFKPGVYYLSKGGFTLKSAGCARPSTDTGDGTGGTIFYMADTDGKHDTFSAQGSGGDCNPGNRTITNFDTSNSKCPGATLPTFIPTTISGSVLLAPCSGDYGDPNPDADDLTKNPNGRQRGILFFQNRAQAATPVLAGGSKFSMAGAMYIHQCTAGADGSADPGANTTCSSSAYGDQVQFKGGSGSTSYVIGAIISDKLQMSSGTTINMVLNNNVAYTVLKAALFR